MDSTVFVGTLKTKFRNATKHKHVTFLGDAAQYETVIEESNDAVYHFHLTLLPSLEHRPEKGNQNQNPFSQPEPELTVCESYGEPSELRIVLNKYPVVENHFLMVTKEFQSQNTPLSASQLFAIYNMLDVLKRTDEGLDWFSFYNCGPHSGASQPHKHVQFMTLPKGHKNFSSELVKQSGNFSPDHSNDPLQDQNIPFAHFVAAVPKLADITSDSLAMIFSSLLQRTLTVLSQEGIHDVSYNVCFTTTHMMMVPRSNSKFDELVGINSCGYMGLILCKNSQILDTVKDNGILSILTNVSCPTHFGRTSDEYDY